ncbi:MAG: transporter, partial [Calditrichaeota bacterium]|nr:transporter [Calditrichota bacterium]
YQDNHKDGSGYNLPDDLILQIKAADFCWKNKNWRFGGKVSLRIPTAKYHNIILEPYNSGKLTLGIFALSSYSTSQNFPDLALNFHANLGLIDHNDHGVYWYNDGNSKILQRHNSREVIAAVGIVYPSTNFDFSAELLGNYFLSKPSATVFSRHNYLYFTPSVTFSPLYWLSFGVGLDLRLSPNRSSASPAIDSDLPAYLPTYPTWRVNLKTNINLSARLQNRAAKKEVAKPVATVVTPQEDVSQKITKEKKHIEKAELELMQLIEKRKQMDEILSRLKKALTEEKEKKAKKK